MALVNKQAAIYVKDADAPQQLIQMALDVVRDAAKLQSLHENILKMALPASAEIIAKEVIKLAEKAH
jgi:UDP-N-acetylglucosamine--N-acetylmuramyl-(pentapeptide) pyrophosphoryl-undecaprenol N-acetylglucosamine transferase